MPRTYEDSKVKHWNTNVKNLLNSTSKKKEIDRQKSEEVRQMNIKDKATGDHVFHNVSTGVQGVALTDYRPGRK